MNQQTRRILNYIKIIILILLFILLFYIIIKYNSNMKLVFFGDCMFGRNNNKFIKNPFIHVEEILKQGSYIFFNLETTISPQLLSNDYRENKTFNYQSNGEQLIELKKKIKKPIFVSIVNNHSLDYGEQGHKNTKRFLKSNNYLCNSKLKVEYDNIIFYNATDHCGCNNHELWKEHITMIDYNNLEPIYKKIRNNKDKFIVFSIHWGSNWVKGEMPKHIKDFGRKLIDEGVNIVFGHSAHHIVKNPIEEYNGGIIIYGLGDFINDYAVKESYQSDKALICVIRKYKNKLEYQLIKVKREFVQEGSSIPILEN